MQYIKLFFLFKSREIIEPEKINDETSHHNRQSCRRTKSNSSNDYRQIYLEDHRTSLQRDRKSNNSLPQNKQSESRKSLGEMSPSIPRNSTTKQNNNITPHFNRDTTIPKSKFCDLTRCIHILTFEKERANPRANACHKNCHCAG